MNSVLAEGQAFREKPITCAIAGLMVVLFLISLVSSHIIGQVALIVSKTFMTNFYVWNLVTGAFLETNILKLLFGIAGVIYFGSRAESSLGLIGFGQYLIFLLVACGVASSTYIFIGYVITRQEDLLFMPLYGPGGLIAGLSVAAAHPALDAPSPLPIPGMSTAQNIPLSLALVWTLIAFVYSAFTRDYIFVWSGAYFGWCYLRFICPHEDNTFGDTSSQFELVKFFPEVVQKFVQPVSNFAYGVMILLGFFKNRQVPLPQALSDLEVQHEPASPVLGNLSGGPLSKKPADPVSERRRAKAMKLLDEKFAQIAQQEVEWKDDDDEEAMDSSIGGGSDARIPPPSSTSSLPPSNTVALDQDVDGDNWGLEEEGKKDSKNLEDSLNDVAPPSEKRKVIVGKAD